MIALIGPTNLELEVDEGPAEIEIALLMADEQSSSEADRPPTVDVEIQIIAGQLELMYAAGRVNRHTDGSWIVYTVTPNVCRRLLFLLLKRSNSVPQTPL